MSMKTPEEIKSGLECWAKELECTGRSCPYWDTFSCGQKIGQDALEYINELEAKQQKWISVDDKDPEFPCITYDGENPPEIPHEIHTLIKGDGEKRHFSYDPFEMEKFFLDHGQDVDMFAMTHITHWMPVPKPPKEWKSNEAD